MDVVQAASGAMYHNATLTRLFKELFSADGGGGARNLAGTEFSKPWKKKQEPKDRRERHIIPSAFLLKWGGGSEGRRAQSAPPRNSEHFGGIPRHLLTFLFQRANHMRRAHHSSASLFATHLLGKPVEGLTPGVP